jgi:hypothetical protein
MFWEISGDDSAGTLVNTIYTRNMPIIKRNNFDDKRIWSIKITSPIKGQTVKASSNLIINTSTTNSNYDITKVEFFVDDKSIGYDTKAPFDWVWFNTQKGSHKIKVIATDISGNKKSSKEVTVNIY